MCGATYMFPFIHMLLTCAYQSVWLYTCWCLHTFLYSYICSVCVCIVCTQLCVLTCMWVSIYVVCIHITWFIFTMLTYMLVYIHDENMCFVNTSVCKHTYSCVIDGHSCMCWCCICVWLIEYIYIVLLYIYGVRA